MFKEVDEVASLPKDETVWHKKLDCYIVPDRQKHDFVRDNPDKHRFLTHGEIGILKTKMPKNNDILTILKIKAVFPGGELIAWPEVVYNDLPRA